MSEGQPYVYVGLHLIGGAIYHLIGIYNSDAQAEEALILYASTQAVISDDDQLIIEQRIMNSDHVRNRCKVNYYRVSSVVLKEGIYG
jgi:hypothetical protein